MQQEHKFTFGQKISGMLKSKIAADSRFPLGSKSKSHGNGNKTNCSYPIALGQTLKFFRLYEPIKRFLPPGRIMNFVAFTGNL